MVQADGVWKGARLAELEDRVSGEVSDQLGLDLWDVHVPMLDLMDVLAVDADERLFRQTSYPATAS